MVNIACVSTFLINFRRAVCLRVSREGPNTRFALWVANLWAAVMLAACMVYIDRVWQALAMPYSIPWVPPEIRC
jgi:hypothetical protein